MPNRGASSSTIDNYKLGQLEIRRSSDMHAARRKSRLQRAVVADFYGEEEDAEDEKQTVLETQAEESPTVKEEKSVASPKVTRKEETYEERQE